MNATVEFRIVLLHEDLVSGLRASSVLERLAGQLDIESEHLDAEIWKFERLLQPKERAQAFAPLMEAKMIIISAGGSVDLPEHIKEIIEDAFRLRKDKQAAIVALLDWEQATSAELPRAGVYLKNLAASIGLDFFCNKGAWQPPEETPGGPAPTSVARNFVAANPVISCDA